VVKKDEPLWGGSRQADMKRGAPPNFASQVSGHSQSKPLPTWAHYATRPPEQIAELAEAVKHPYPHFLAVLKPERAFLHYLISGVIANTQIEDKEQLRKIVRELYEENVDVIRQRYSGLKDSLEADIKGYSRNTEDYFTRRKAGIPTREDGLEAILSDSSANVSNGFSAARSDMISTSFSAFAMGSGKIKHVNHERDLAYDAIRHTNHTGHVQGASDTIDLKNQKRVFVAYCADRFLEEDIKAIVKPVADAAIQTAIKAGRLTPLPKMNGSSDKDADDCRIVVITGNIAAGKTRLLSKLKSPSKKFEEELGVEQPVDRKKFAMIDIDEFRDLDDILGEGKEKDRDPSWGIRVHDECHMIRRKIFDELESQEKKGIYTNVVLMTSHLSPRIYDWMTAGNKNIDVYCLYCEPDNAIKNARLRSQRDKGYDIPKYSILSSFRDLAITLRVLFTEETEEKSKMRLRLIDTSKVDTRKSADAVDGMDHARLIMSADADNGVQIRDFDSFVRVHKGYCINPGSRHHRAESGQLFQNLNAEKFTSELRAMLREHNVHFHDVGLSKPLRKKAGQDVPDFEKQPKATLKSQALRTFLEQRTITGLNAQVSVA
jgi:hypothetical protein